jgi:hypothetical protein
LTSDQNVQRSYTRIRPIHLAMYIRLRNQVFAITSVVLVLFGQRLASAEPVQIMLGQSVVKLNRPWKFYIGDSASWADSGFDDSASESTDLTPNPGAHDGDVGLTGFLPGWGARGHADYSGFAWYRMRVVVSPVAHPFRLRDRRQ